MLAGADQPLGKMIQKFVSDQGGNGDCTIVGSTMRTSQYMAALGNGTLGHALDYDDMGGFGHPSVALLPPALAIAEELDLTVNDLLAASDVYKRQYQGVQVLLKEQLVSIQQQYLGRWAQLQ